METLKRIAAFLLRRELVWLLDHDGTVALALARRTPFGMECYHPQTKRRCLLFLDGSLQGPSYVDEWKPYNGGLTGWSQFGQPGQHRLE